MHMLLIGAWPELAERLVGLPSRVTLLQRPELASAREAAWAHRYVKVDYHDLEAAVEVVARIHKEDPVDVVACFRELGLPTLDAVAKRVGLPAVSGPAESLGKHKAEVRGLLNDGGCLPVRHRVCKSRDDLARFAADVGYPVIVKPSVGYVMGGAYAVDHAGAVAQAWQHVTDATDEEIVAEQLLVGPEFSVETRSVNGAHEVVMITEKQTTGPPYFIEIGHVVPARIPVAVAELVGAEAVRALVAAGHRTGPSHVEVILTDAGAGVVEINRRLAGGRIWELIQLATGRDMMLESLTDAAGATPSVASGPARGAAIMFLYSDEARQIADELPVDAANEVPELVRTKITATAGSPAHPLVAPGARLGYVMTVAGTGDDAANAAERARRLVLDRLFG
jgi:biotin carboxylase